MVPSPEQLICGGIACELFGRTAKVSQKQLDAADGARIIAQPQGIKKLFWQETLKGVGSSGVGSSKVGSRPTSYSPTSLQVNLLDRTHGQVETPRP